MTITLEIPDSLEVQLQARGMALDACLLQNVLPAAAEKLGYGAADSIVNGYLVDMNVPSVLTNSLAAGEKSGEV